MKVVSCSESYRIGIQCEDVDELMRLLYEINEVAEEWERARKGIGELE